MYILLYNIHAVNEVRRRLLAYIKLGLLRSIPHQLAPGLEEDCSHGRNKPLSPDTSSPRLVSHHSPNQPELQCTHSRGILLHKGQTRQQWPTYSMPTDKIRVDLIHIFCGQIKTNGAASGFHARPGNTDPPSALTKFAVQVRKPHDKYDYAIYSSPSMYDIKYVKKDGYNHIWPTACVWRTLQRSL